jgi:hypothetical protein
MNDDHTVSHQFIKVLTALAAGFGLKSWGDVASFCAAAYTLILIGEWLYKKVKPWFKR